MSSNGGGSGFLGLLLILAFVTAAVWLVAVALFYALMGLGVFMAFIAFAWTLVCLSAWNAPFRLGRIYLDPGNARAFVLRGVFGACVVPLFLTLADAFSILSVNWRYAPHYVAGGYTLLSAGLEYLFARRADVPYVSYDDIPHPPQLPPPPAVKTLPGPAAFRFARWDDEDERP